nr:unnamed protein product [Callosobruchus analis]
MIVVQLY